MQENQLLSQAFANALLGSPLLLLSQRSDCCQADVLTCNSGGLPFYRMGHAGVLLFSQQLETP